MRPPGTGENAIVELLKNRYAVDCPTLKQGIGDDAAVWRPRGADEFWAVTTDMLVEEIDFRHEWTSPQELGYKSLAVNLSDLAAMGARPCFYTVSLALPRNIPVVSRGATVLPLKKWIEKFYDGMAACAVKHGAALVGGDLSGGDRTVVSVTAFGESRKRKILYRSGGRAGDLLYVTGVLGKSAAGLELLRQGTLHARSAAKREALRAHRMPEPRCAAGVWLARSGCVRAMMDLSDGLAADLPRLCAASGASGASGLAAEILLEKIPVFPEAAAWGCDPLGLALGGGEDYELLFAVPRAKKKLLEASWPSGLPAPTHIGNIIDGNGEVWLAAEGGRRPLETRGFDHFA